MGRPVLKIEIGALGFGGGQPKGMRAYEDLRDQLKKWFESQNDMYLDGYSVHSIHISICEQLDDLHCITKEITMARKQD